MWSERSRRGSGGSVKGVKKNEWRKRSVKKRDELISGWASI